MIIEIFTKQKGNQIETLIIDVNGNSFDTIYTKIGEINEKTGKPSKTETRRYHSNLTNALSDCISVSVQGMKAEKMILQDLVERVKETQQAVKDALARIVKNYDGK